MRYGAALSAIFHVAIIVIALVGLPSLLNSKRTEIVAVAVEIVTPEMLEKQASLPPKPEPPKPEPKKVEPPKPEPPKPAPPKAAAPTPPPTPEPPKAPEPAPATKPAPPPEPIAKPEPLPEPKPKPKAKTPEPPKPKVVKPKPPPPEKQVAARTPPARTPAPVPKRKPKPPQDEFQSLLKNLAKEKQQQAKKKPAPSSKVAKQTDPTPRVSPLQARMMAASLSQAVMQQVTPCWSIPAGAKDAADMSVAIRIRLNPDGALGAQPRIEDTGRIGRDPFFRAVAESALRALRNPRCMPLKLPYDQYDMWKDITFVFDPKEALGQ